MSEKRVHGVFAKVLNEAGEPDAGWMDAGQGSPLSLFAQGKVTPYPNHIVPKVEAL